MLKPERGFACAVDVLGLADSELMEMLYQTTLKHMPSEPVCIGNEKEAEHRQLKSPFRPFDSMETHSDLRACARILLLLATALPADQVTRAAGDLLFGP